MYATPPAGTPYPPTWSGETGAPPPSPSGPGSISPEVSQYAKDWPLANHDYNNTQAALE